MLICILLGSFFPGYDVLKNIFSGLISGIEKYAPVHENMDLCIFLIPEINLRKYFSK